MRAPPLIDDIPAVGKGKEGHARVSDYWLEMPICTPIIIVASEGERACCLLDSGPTRHETERPKADYTKRWIAADNGAAIMI